MASDTVVQYVLKVDSKGPPQDPHGTPQADDATSQSLDKFAP